MLYTHTCLSGHIHVVHSVATSYTLSIKTVKTIKIKVKIKIKTHTRIYSTCVCYQSLESTVHRHVVRLVCDKKTNDASRCR